MGLLELLLLAVGLAMDAFAVSICGSLALAPASRFSGALRFGIWFGFFQALMPVVGFFCAIRFRSYIETYDHWIAFILLIYLGINMLREADAADSCNLKQHYNIREMLTLAVATSIDAAQRFTVRLYVSDTVYDNVSLRNALALNTIKVIDKNLKNTIDKHILENNLKEILKFSGNKQLLSKI